MENPDINANSADPDQTPLSAALDLGLHSLPMSSLWDRLTTTVAITKPTFDYLPDILNTVKNFYVTGK